MEAAAVLSAATANPGASDLKLGSMAPGLVSGDQQEDFMAILTLISQLPKPIGQHSEETSPEEGIKPKQKEDFCAPDVAVFQAVMGLIPATWQPYLQSYFPVGKEANSGELTADHPAVRQVLGNATGSGMMTPETLEGTTPPPAELDLYKNLINQLLSELSGKIFEIKPTITNPEDKAQELLSTSYFPGDDLAHNPLNGHLPKLISDDDISQTTATKTSILSAVRVAHHENGSDQIPLSDFLNDSFKVIGSATQPHQGVKPNGDYKGQQKAPNQIAVDVDRGVPVVSDKGVTAEDPDTKAIRQKNPVWVPLPAFNESYNARLNYQPETEGNVPTNRIGPELNVLAETPEPTPPGYHQEPELGPISENLATQNQLKPAAAMGFNFASEHQQVTANNNPSRPNVWPKVETTAGIVTVLENPLEIESATPAGVIEQRVSPLGLSGWINQPENNLFAKQPTLDRQEPQPNPAIMQDLLLDENARDNRAVTKEVQFEGVPQPEIKAAGQGARTNQTAMDYEELSAKQPADQELSSRVKSIGSQYQSRIIPVVSLASGSFNLPKPELPVDKFRFKKQPALDILTGITSTGDLNPGEPQPNPAIKQDLFLDENARGNRAVTKEVPFEGAPIPEIKAPGQEIRINQTAMNHQELSAKQPADQETSWRVKSIGSQYQSRIVPVVSLVSDSYDVTKPELPVGKFRFLGLSAVPPAGTLTRSETERTAQQVYPKEVRYDLFQVGYPIVAENKSQLNRSLEKTIINDSDLVTSPIILAGQTGNIEGPMEAKSSRNEQDSGNEPPNPDANPNEEQNLRIKLMSPAREEEHPVLETNAGIDNAKKNDLTSETEKKDSLGSIYLQQLGLEFDQVTNKPSSLQGFPSLVRQIFGEIEPQVKSVDRRIREFTIQLHPVELGQVNISLRWENGQLHMHLFAAEAATATSLQQVIPELRERLESMGVTCGLMEMGLGHRQSDWQPPRQYEAAPSRIRNKGQVAVGQGSPGIASDIGINYHEGLVNVWI